MRWRRCVRERVAGRPAEIIDARVAVGAIFFVNGLVLASWLPHIPAVKAAHAISDGELGLVLFAWRSARCSRCPSPASSSDVSAAG